MRKGILWIVSAMALSAGCTGQSTAEQFKQTAAKLNKTYPVRLSETVTIDSTRYDEKENTVSYFYTVTGTPDDPRYMETHYAAFRQALKEAIDNAVEMEAYRKAGCRIKYIYMSGKSRKQLSEFSF